MTNGKKAIPAPVNKQTAYSSGRTREKMPGKDDDNKECGHAEKISDAFGKRRTHLDTERSGAGNQ